MFLSVLRTLKGYVEAKRLPSTQQIAELKAIYDRYREHLGSSRETIRAALAAATSCHVQQLDLALHRAVELIRLYHRKR